MKIETEKVQAAKNAFNKIKVLKGQTVSIATCDPEGNPNVAPIGSMRVIDESTVHILQGFLPRTCSNLKNNPKVTFLVCLRPKLFDSLSLFGDKPDGVLGYQVYCEYVGADDAKAVVEQESRLISKRIPFLLRGLFMKFCRKNLSRLLKFKIMDIREIAAP